MAKILIPLPKIDFDPTESGVPATELIKNGHEVVFATPDGTIASADKKTLTGDGLGIFKKALMADSNGIKAYEEMIKLSSYKNPISYEEIINSDYQALILVGGHAPGMRAYLESIILQNLVSDFFEKNKLVAAVCHGVVLAARSIKKNKNESVLFGKKTTCLLKIQENIAYWITRRRLGNYYRTYPEITVEDEVMSVLSSPADLIKGPLPLTRDNKSNLGPGFVCQDGNYISARWPGDIYSFTDKIMKTLES